MVAALEKAREGEFRETKRVKASADAEIFIVTKDRCGMSYSCVRDGCVETQVVRRSTIDDRNRRSKIFGFGADDLQPLTTLLHRRHADHCIHHLLDSYIVCTPMQYHLVGVIFMIRRRRFPQVPANDSEMSSSRQKGISRHISTLVNLTDR